MALSTLSSLASEQEVIDKINEIIAHLNGAKAEPAEGCVTKGKYKGRKCEDIVREDPWYIQWAVSQDISPLSFGFTAEQEDQALADPRPEPQRRR